MYVLIAAIGLGRKLTSETDIDVIFRELETMDNKKYWGLLNNLIRTPEEQRTWLELAQEKSLTVLQKVGGWTGDRGLRKFVPTSLSSAAANQASKLQHRMAHPPELEDPHSRFAPLLLDQSELDKTKLYFKFVLNKSLSFNRYGINTGKESDKLEDERIKFEGSLGQIRKVVVSNFATEIATVGSVMLGSIANLILTDSPSYDTSTLKSKYIDHDMINSLNKSGGTFEQIFKTIETGLVGETADDARYKIKQLKQFSSIDTSGYLDSLSINIANNSIKSRDFGLSHWRDFRNSFDELIGTSDSISSRLENELSYLTLETEKHKVMNQLQLLQQGISASIDDFFSKFKEDLRDAPTCRLAQILNTDNTTIVDKTIPKFESGLSKIFYAILLSKLQAALGEYLSVADNQLEMVKNEVTAWPNYTLVLPVEIILALHAALMGTSWQHLLKGGQPGTDLITRNTLTQKINTPVSKKDQVSSLSNVNDSYIKPAIKYIANRLEVPNLIIVDSKRGDIYYKLMNQTDVNRTKITTIGTYIDSKINHQITQQY